MDLESLVKASNDACGYQRVSASKVKEIIMNANAFDPQELLINGRDVLLDIVARCNKGIFEIWAWIEMRRRGCCGSLHVRATMPIARGLSGSLISSFSRLNPVALPLKGIGWEDHATRVGPFMEPVPV